MVIKLSLETLSLNYSIKRSFNNLVIDSDRSDVIREELKKKYGNSELLKFIPPTRLRRYCNYEIDMCEENYKIKYIQIKDERSFQPLRDF